MPTNPAARLGSWQDRSGRSQGQAIAAKYVGHRGIEKQPPALSDREDGVTGEPCEGQFLDPRQPCDHYRLCPERLHANDFGLDRRRCAICDGTLGDMLGPDPEGDWEPG